MAPFNCWRLSLYYQDQVFSWSHTKFAEKGFFFFFFFLRVIWRYVQTSVSNLVVRVLPGMLLPRAQPMKAESWLMRCWQGRVQYTRDLARRSPEWQRMRLGDWNSRWRALNLCGWLLQYRKSPLLLLACKCCLGRCYFPQCEALAQVDAEGRQKPCICDAGHQCCCLVSQWSALGASRGAVQDE